MAPPALSLPAAATTTTLRACANSTAACRAGVLTVVASDKLITFAPRFTASRIAWAVTWPGKVSEFVILTERMAACGATPANEMPATGAAAMMLATDVPWPTQSAPAGAPNVGPARSGPTVTRSPNCGLASTPLSTTATVTPAPWVSGQTPEKPSACCAHGVAAGAAMPCVPGQPGHRPGQPGRCAAGPPGRGRYPGCGGRRGYGGRRECGRGQRGRQAYAGAQHSPGPQGGSPSHGSTSGKWLAYP